MDKGNNIIPSAPTIQVTGDLIASRQNRFIAFMPNGRGQRRAPTGEMERMALPNNPKTLSAEAGRTFAAPFLVRPTFSRLGQCNPLLSHVLVNDERRPSGS